MRAPARFSALLFVTACAHESTPTPPAPVATARETRPSPPAVEASSAPKPPLTRRDDFREVMHGAEIVDPYRWLEDQDSPETRAWIDAQNAYTHSLLDRVDGRDAIRARLAALEKYDDRGTPFERGGRIFVMQHRAEDDLWTLHVQKDDKDDVLLDPHPLSADHTTDVPLSSTSEDGTRIVYGVRRGGEDETELRVRDVATGRDLPDALPRALYRGASLEPHGKGFFYELQDRAKGVRVRYHVMGKPIASDVEVFGDGYGPNDWVWGGFPDEGRHAVYVVSHGWAKNDVFVQTPPLTGPIKPIVRGLDAHVAVDYAGDRLIAETDLDAPSHRIVEIDPAHPSPDRWRTIVPAGPDAIQRTILAGGRIVVEYLHDVTSRLAVFGLDGASLGEIKLPGIGMLLGINGHWKSDELYFGFSSYTTPRITLRASVSKLRAEPIFRANVPFAGDDVEVTQVWVTSKDGTRVPMFLAQKKGTPRDGARPTLLYGYGGFDVSERPRFNTFAAWFVEQGGVYALANIRGGAEFGEAWHRAGMLAKKQNVFDDFIAAAEWLAANKVTSPEHLAIQGGSNGGLLVGAVMTQRPELFRAVLCEYPDLDMLGYYRFKNNNPPALLEYGDASKPEEFKFLAAYSPYQRVTPGTRYPAVFLRTGDEDTRVPPLQARKMTARLQAASTSGRPIVLLYDTKSGHAGGEPLGTSIENASLELAFLASQLGIPIAK
jgi:prolyl oligopeptidase